MIRLQPTLDDLTREGAYLLGWQDHADSLELAAEGESALQASRAGRRLGDLLDRIYGIAPYELEPVAALAGEVKDAPVADGPFDWSVAA